MSPGTYEKCLNGELLSPSISWRFCSIRHGPNVYIHQNRCSIAMYLVNIEHVLALYRSEKTTRFWHSSISQSEDIPEYYPYYFNILERAYSLIINNNTKS